MFGGRNRRRRFTFTNSKRIWKIKSANNFHFKVTCTKRHKKYLSLLHLKLHKFLVASSSSPPPLSTCSAKYHNKNSKLILNVADCILLLCPFSLAGLFPCFYDRFLLVLCSTRFFWPFIVSKSEGEINHFPSVLVRLNVERAIVLFLSELTLWSHRWIERRKV